MKIKDLPTPLQDRALANQIAQGNEPNGDIILTVPKASGGFDWGDSIEGDAFWLSVVQNPERGVQVLIGFMAETLSKKYPNDMEFGRAIRELLNSK